jgi:hypothetical protein
VSRGRWGWLWPPLVTFVLARLFYAWAARAAGFDPWSAGSWRRWDSGHYLAIATRGYEMFSCARIGGRATDVCGNAAWFPLYPWLLRLGVSLGMPPELAGAVLASAFALALLVALWTLFFARAGRAGWLLLAMAAVFPGAVYQHAIFPTSLALLCLVLAAAMGVQSRWAAAGGMGALVALSYVTGVLLAPVQAMAAWLRTRALRPALLAGGLPALGFLAVLAFHQGVLGRWDAFYWVHRKGFRGPGRPVEAFLAVVRPAFDGGADMRARTIAAQTLTVAALVLLGLAMAWRQRSKPDPVRAWAVLATLAFWTFPLAMGRGVSLYRSEALVLPVLFLLVDLPPWALALLLTWLAVLAQAMGRLFFTGYLV